MKYFQKFLEYFRSKIRLFIIQKRIKKLKTTISFRDRYVDKWQEDISNKKFLNRKEFEDYTKKIEGYYIKCSICEKKIDPIIMDFKCHYCDRYYCRRHRLPESHKCDGKLKSPPASYRKIYEGGREKVYTK